MCRLKRRHASRRCPSGSSTDELVPNTQTAHAAVVNYNLPDAVFSGSPGYATAWTTALATPSYSGMSDPTTTSIQHYIENINPNGFGLSPVIERMVFETDERQSSSNMDYNGITTRPRCSGCDRPCTYTCKRIDQFGYSSAGGCGQGSLLTPVTAWPTSAPTARRQTHATTTTGLCLQARPAPRDLARLQVTAARLASKTKSQAKDGRRAGLEHLSSSAQTKG